VLHRIRCTIDQHGVSAKKRDKTNSLQNQSKVSEALIQVTPRTTNQLAPQITQYTIYISVVTQEYMRTYSLRYETQCHGMIDECNASKHRIRKYFLQIYKLVIAIYGEHKLNTTYILRSL
jgi:hypothetical protein